jgi:hypothetical protein
MTYDEWLKTERQHNDLSGVDDVFGYSPATLGKGEPAKVVNFDPGLAVIFDDGQWFTHIGRGEYFGTPDEIRRVPWDEYAQHEVGDSPWCTTTPPKEDDE